MNQKIDELITGWNCWGPDYYNDGVITYKAPPRSDFTKAFKKLERRLGIDTKRVKSWKKADIVCEWGIMPEPHWAGYHASKTDSKRNRCYSKVVVEEGNWYSQSTVVHEIGHALGMAHPEDHSRTDTIMSYGAPGDLPWFTKLDEQVLDYLY